MPTTVLEACPNSDGRRAEAPCLPITPDGLAAQVRTTMEAPPSQHTKPAIRL